MSRPPMFITMESARMTNGPGTCVALITDEETEIDMSKPGMDKVQLHLSRVYWIERKMSGLER